MLSENKQVRFVSVKAERAPYCHASRDNVMSGRGVSRRGGGVVGGSCTMTTATQT